MRWLALGLTLLAACGGTQERSAPSLYKQYCARCHGAQGQGPRRPVRLYPRLNLLTSPMVLQGDRAAVRQRIADGHGPMPAFYRRLTPEEIEKLVEFTLELPSRKAGP